MQTFAKKFLIVSLTDTSITYAKSNKRGQGVYERKGGVRVEAIVPAAGLGLRLKTKLPKPLVKLNTKPILIYTLEALSKNKCIERIIIAVSRENKYGFASALKKFRIPKRIDLVYGGKTRRESVEHCLKEITPDTDFILIHDAARPFLSERLIEQCLREVKKSRAVICGVPVKGTIKQIADGRLQMAGIFVKKTLNRDSLWEIQTPQIFRKDLLLEAYVRFKDSRVTDDASLVEKLGIKVKVILGSYFNIKITTPEDLVIARAILSENSY